MKTIKILAAVAFIVIAAFATSAFIKAKTSSEAAFDNKGFAVVELFTSEGCSSCPPADELVARIQKESTGKPVYILAYHVDYWNRLGWKDQFSSAAFSKRQNDYANYLNLNSVYTPQIVVNGRTEFVGSQEGTLRNAIRTSLQKEPVAQLALNVASIDQDHAALKYNTQGTDKSTVLLIAVLQKNAQTKVLRGENGGSTLSHVQIVRNLQEFNLNGSNGAISVDLPHGFDKKGWEIIGFLQNKTNGAVTGVSRAPLGNDAAIAGTVANSK